MIRVPRLAGFALLGLLAGCGSMSSLNPFADKSPKPACPRISVPADAANLTRFRPGPGQDLIDIQFEARLADVRHGCEHDLDKEVGGGKLSIELTISVEGSRGPADTTREAKAAYFVSLLNAETKEPLQKKVFPVTMTFPGNYTRTTVTDNPVTLEVPLEPGKYGRDFLIYAGMQLSQQELEYNIRKRQMTGR